MEVCASSFSLPSLASGSINSGVSNMNVVRLATRSITAGMLP
ncbi:Uncharacterised protein [Bordetella pertussis]|nr:Uncharacterised protein [Bordetella pertussis]